MWWLALVMALVPAEQWADEAPVKEAPVVIDSPRLGPVVGVHLGTSLSTETAEVGGRLGARFRPARHFAVSLFADVQWTFSRVWSRCEGFRACDVTPYSTTLLSGVARFEFISEGKLGPLLVPRFTAGIYVGGIAGYAPELSLNGRTYAAEWAPGARFGLHLGFTRLPNDWWFPLFLDVGAVCGASSGCGDLRLVVGIGI